MSRNWASFFCTTFSKSFDNMGSRDTGRKLVAKDGSPALKSGITCASLKAVGTVSLTTDALNSVELSLSLSLPPLSSLPASLPPPSLSLSLSHIYTKFLFSPMVRVVRLDPETIIGRGSALHLTCTSLLAHTWVLYVLCCCCSCCSPPFNVGMWSFIKTKQKTHESHHDSQLY